MNLFLIASVAVIAVAAAGFVGGTLLWLRHLRVQLSNSLRETLNRQINHGQKVEEALTFLQRNQTQAEAQVRALADAQTRARADLNALREKVEQREVSNEAGSGHGRVIH
jgi:uncharacterized protein HemX